MKYLFLIIIITIALFSFSQNINQKIFDNNYNDSLIVGLCNAEVFENDPYNSWFLEEYNHYYEKQGVLEEIKINALDIEIIIVLGVWCSDSRREYPRFIKLLDLLDFDKNNLTIIAVDTDKQALSIDITEYGINLVPTFIFYKNNIEIGRIIETPKLSLEEDFLNILNSNKR